MATVRLLFSIAMPATPAAAGELGRWAAAAIASLVGHMRLRLTLSLTSILLGCSSQSPASVSARAGVADFQGIGAAIAGMRLPEAVVALGGTVDTSGGPISDGNCNYAFFSALPKGTAVMVFGDTIARFDVDSTGFLTTVGVGVGSSELEVRRAYGASRVQQESHPYSGPEWHYLIVDPPSDTLHRIIFETDGQRVRSYRVGWRRAVDQIEGCS